MIALMAPGDDIQKEIMRLFLEEGLGLKKIARETGTYPMRVKRILSESGAYKGNTRRPRSTDNYRKQKINEILGKLDKIIERLCKKLGTNQG